MGQVSTATGIRTFPVGTRVARDMRRKVPRLRVSHLAGLYPLHSPRVLLHAPTAGAVGAVITATVAIAGLPAAPIAATTARSAAFGTDDLALELARGARLAAATTASVAAAAGTSCFVVRGGKRGGDGEGVHDGFSTKTLEFVFSISRY